MLKIKFAQRLLAALLGLIVAFLACACTPEDMGVSQEQSVAEIEKETGALELSEMGAEGVADEKITASEQIEETISIEPVEPIYPEERETMLEKVLSFDIGIEGMFQYRFLFYDDPSVAGIELPGDIFCASDGKMYHYVDTSAGRRLICLNSGEYMDIHQGDLRDMLIKDKTLYIMTMDGSVFEFDISNGLSQAVVSNEYQIFDKFSFEELGTLVDLGGKQPIVHTNKNEFVTFSQKRLLASECPYVFSDDKTGSADVQLSAGVAPQWLIQRDAVSVVDVTSECIIVREKDTPEAVTVYTAYDKNGDLLFRFAEEDIFGFEKTPCEIEFERFNNRYTVQECALYTVVIEKNVFEDVLSGRVFFAPNGDVYFAAYYTDHCDVYLVNAGYTGESFAKDENVMAEEDSIAPMSTASADSASSVQWLDISRSEVESNATAMINLPWTIRQGNLTPRNTGTVELPIYLM